MSAAVRAEVGPTVARPTSAQPVLDLPALTGLRLVAATWVLLFHAQVVSGSFLHPAFVLGDPLVRNGPLGVDLFFMLSGFLITQTYGARLGPCWRRADVGRYLWARMARVWPAFFVVLNISGVWLWLGTRHHTVLAWSLQTHAPDFSVWGWVRQVFMVNLWTRPLSDGACWFGPGWTISAEALAYLAFPVLALGLWRVRRLPPALLLTAGTLCAVPVAVLPVLLGRTSYQYSWLVQIAGCFLAGALSRLGVSAAAVGRPTVRRRDGAGRTDDAVPVRRWDRLVLVTVAVTLVALWLLPVRAGTLAVLAFPALLVALTRAHLAATAAGPARARSRSVRAALDHPLAQHGGRLSYSLYLVHMPVVYAYFWAVRLHPGVGAHTALGAAAALACLLLPFALAQALYAGIEQPARVWLLAHRPGRMSLRASRGA